MATSKHQITQILCALENGDAHAAEQLLPLVYDELRKLAAHRMTHESAGQTLQPTALVHEAYLRLVEGAPATQHWHNRGHFFAAAAEAMRRILIDRARHRLSLKGGGGQRPLDLTHLENVPADDGRSDDELLALNEALDELEKHDQQAARLVNLRYFAGLSHQEAADAMGITRRAADRLWALARAWLYRQINRP